MKRLTRILLTIAGSVLALVLAAAALVAYALLHVSGDVEPLGGGWEVFHTRPSLPEAGGYHKILRRKARFGSDDVAVVTEYRYVGDDCVAYVSYYHELYSACGQQAPAFITYFGAKSSIAADPLRIEDRELSIADVKRLGRETHEERIGGGWLAMREAFPKPGAPPGIRVYRTDRKLWPTVRSPVVRYRYVGDDCLLVLDALAGVDAICGDGKMVWIPPLPDVAEFDHDPIQIYNGRVTVEQLKRQAKQCTAGDCLVSP